MKAVIISGGIPPTRELLQEEIADASILICADSGANCLYEFNITPDILIGDFDSIDPKVLDYFMSTGCYIERLSKDKDFTDSEICLRKALEHDINKIVFLGATGGRMDHTLGNLGLLKRCLEIGITSYIMDDSNFITITNKSCELVGKKGEYFSLLAYSDMVEGLTIEGAKYNLLNYNLALGDSLTVSNEFLEEKIKISIRSGTILIIKSKD